MQRILYTNFLILNLEIVSSQHVASLVRKYIELVVGNNDPEAKKIVSF